MSDDVDREWKGSEGECVRNGVLNVVDIVSLLLLVLLP